MLIRVLVLSAAFIFAPWEFCQTEAEDVSEAEQTKEPEAEDSLHQMERLLSELCGTDWRRCIEVPDEGVRTEFQVPEPYVFGLTGHQ